MLRFLKFALLWLLVFALPVQGFASSGMLACVGVHHHSMAKISQFDGDGTDGGQFSSTVLHQEDTGVADASTGSIPKNDRHHHGAAKCSACSSCCLSAAISFPVTRDPIAPLQTGLAFHSQLDVRFTAHFPEGLERPPQSLVI